MSHSELHTVLSENIFKLYLLNEWGTVRGVLDS